MPKPEPLLLPHPAAEVTVTPEADGHRIEIRMYDPAVFIGATSRLTRYPVELIRKVLQVKGPAYLCDEIARDEDPGYVEVELMSDLLAYRPESAFEGRRILDFGCGSGASTMILARHFKTARIVGIDLSPELVSLARARRDFYGAGHVELEAMTEGTGRLEAMEPFDFIVMNAVYEHLLPGERRAVIGALWRRLKSGGILFINETPHRYWLKDSHTTGLYLINYLPDWLAAPVARRCSRRVEPDATWPQMLRNGIRGGSERELLGLVGAADGRGAEILEPCRLGLVDRIDLWSHILQQRGRHTPKTRKVAQVAKVLKKRLGWTVLPTFSIAISPRPRD